MIELWHVDIRTWEISSTAPKAEADDAGNLSTADQTTTRVTEASISWSIHSPGAEESYWNLTLIWLGAITNLHWNDLKLNAKQDRVGSSVRFICRSPKRRSFKFDLKYIPASHHPASWQFKLSNGVLNDRGTARSVGVWTKGVKVRTTAISAL